MKHIPYLCHDLKSFFNRVDEFAGQLADMESYSDVLVTIFLDIHLKDEAPKLISKVRKTLPDAKIVGGTASANITAGVINLYGISLTFSVFNEAKVEVFPIMWEDARSHEIGDRTRERLEGMEQLKAVEMLTSGYAVNTMPFFRELSQMSPEVVFFGGVVDDGTTPAGQGFVFTGDDVVYRGHVMVAFRGSDLNVCVGYGSGWRPLGKIMTVTRLSNSHTICEIDDVPVRTIYEKYLGINSWNEDFLNESVVFPFSIIRNGTSLSRLPRYLDEDGSASYGADFEVGDKVRLCYGDPAIIIQEARNLQMGMLHFNPEGIFAVSCWARKVLLQKDVNQELEACRRGAPSTGIYALGEYMRTSYGDIYLNNMCLSIIGIREGGNVLEHREEDYTRPIRLERQNSVLSHMMHFVQAVSDELEESNMRLQDIAKIDFLTNLLNRGQLETEMSNSLSDSQLSNKHMSVMMLDLDNFKHINDSLGHDTGDEVLKSVAELIRQNIRATDRAGRWGGDEFIIVFNNSDVTVARNVAERIRSKIMGLSTIYKLDKVTVSIGITAATKDDTLLSLFQRVDTAMYKSKNQAGKNCVTVI
ncbi:diguanylate cyclase [Anaerovibrio sp. JC8]|uniref:sensor domain-containing diguanylate cyclase n=1 Tax=Anaerovibrio sp. JC8 TaxID=1240085 RepID=UPI000A0CA969|nr:GGDEF domain-containing protein [Anaerovibrio sp. JC8]ORT98975.1 diguanylate cyclase [Anaerovibrio sp. JC8]